jgi:hypothetical protein
MAYYYFLFLNLSGFLFAGSDNIAWLTTGGKIGFIALLAFSGLAIFNSRKKFSKKNRFTNPEDTVLENDAVEKIMQKCKKQLIRCLNRCGTIYTSGIECFTHEDLTGLKNALLEKKELAKQLKRSKETIYSVAARFENSLHSGHYLIELNDYQIRMINSLSLLLNPLYEHLGNSHKPFIKTQQEELDRLNRKITVFFGYTADCIGQTNENKDENPKNIQKDIEEMLNNMEVAQIKRIKTNQVNTRNSILFLNILSETKNILNHAAGLLHAHIQLTTNLKN